MQINDVTRYEVFETVAVITVHSPPVNALSVQVRAGISEAIGRAAASADVAAAVLICEGRTFFAGADIAELGKPPVTPILRDLARMLDGSAKPFVTAIHGTALGGGLELAMAALYRVALPSARFGLPEVNIGILPGAGGTQRLPRLVGIPMALEMIAGGKQIDAATALEAGLIDAVIDNGTLRDGAVAFARTVLDGGQMATKASERSTKMGDGANDRLLCDDFRKANARKFRGFLAPEFCIRAIEASIALPFGDGLKRERELFEVLIADEQSAALRHMFFAERQAAKIDDIDPATPTLPIAKVGIVGAGTMGGGIAMNFLNVGLPVTIVETKPEALERGLAVIRRNYQATAAKGLISSDDVERRMARLAGSVELEDLADHDLIIEAVFEDLDVKRALFARIDTIAKPDAILATNTSYLDIDAIAAATRRPSSVFGLHFFSPANVMKLLEIVRTKDTAPAIVATAARLAKTIGKIGVIVGNGFGFVGNRMLAARNRQADALILEGALPQDVDRVLVEFGFPMGHFQMRDLVGLDVGWNAAATASATVREILNEMGRHGQKSGSGYYDYDEKRAHRPSSVVEGVVRDFADAQGIARRVVADGEIRDRLLYAMVNEGGRILEEGIATRPSDIDVIWVTGYGWPRYRGGPMFWAERQGYGTVLQRLDALQSAHGEEFAPSPMIERLALERNLKTAA